LLSRRLVHIRNLSEPTQVGPSAISDSRITECIANFQSARIGDILHVQCGIPKREADLFADHLLTEALQNVREHPRATIGMIAISIMGNTNELILSIVDNGDSIPQTIYPVYMGSHADDIEYERENLDLDQRAQIADYATRPGVTRKRGTEAQRPEVGMGLAYIKDDTVKTFKGKLRIITDSVALKYAALSVPDPYSAWEHSWRGNLLRIAIPLPRREAISRASDSSSFHLG